MADETPTAPPATCEEWDEDAQTTLPGTRTSANTAAKGSKPELVPTHSHHRRASYAHADMVSRTSTSTPEFSSSQKVKAGGLTVNTSFPRRDSRPYSSGPPAERPRRNSSRPDAKPKRTISKAEKPEHFMRHQEGQCCLCDTYGYHVLVPPEWQGPSIQKSTPKGPLPDSAPLEATLPEPTNIQPRSNRSWSSTDQRPMSFHAGTEMYYPCSQPFPGVDWSMPPTPGSPYIHPPYPHTPMNPFYPDYPQPVPQQYNEQAPPPPRPRPAEPHQGASSHGEPIIQQSPVSWERPPLTRMTSKSQQQHSRDSSLSRENARMMPPPQRPSMARANASTSIPRERRNSVIYDSVTGSQLQKRRSDAPPPSSYREPLASAHQNGSAHRKSPSYQDVKHVRKMDDSAPVPDRRNSPPSTESLVRDAEAYQKSRGTESRQLTFDALSKIHSDSSGKRSMNNDSSRGSSGSKPNTDDRHDIKMSINGVTMGIKGDGRIMIQPKRSGGVNITVDKTEPNSLHKWSGSSTASSGQSQRSHEKRGLRRLKERGQSSDGGPERRAIKASNMPSQALYDEPPVYGVGYG